jgi:hypothetical protein
MTIRAKLATAIVVAVAGLALTAGVGIWGMDRLGGRFDAVRDAGEARALALQLKYGITDFNGWQTAYGYDDGDSRPVFLRSVESFRRNLARADTELSSPAEEKILARVHSAFDDFMKLDDVAFAALQNGRTEEVRRIFLGPEIANFERAAEAAEALARLEATRAVAADKAFTDARSDALRLLIVASIVAALLVALLLITAFDLARAAEGSLAADSAAEHPDAPA